MDPMLHALARRQWGLLTSHQARQFMTAEEIAATVRSGEWLCVRRGVYALSAAVPDHPTPEQSRRLRDDAACLLMGIEVVRSHASAALVLDLPILREAQPRTHVTALRPGSWRSEYGVVVHVAAYVPADVVVVNGVRCLKEARTALDIARSSPLAHGVVACDSALRRGVGVSELGFTVDRMQRWPGVRRARRALELADPGSDSVGESLARLLLIELGHGVPETQFGLTDGIETAYGDLRIGRHIVEFDGEVKYAGAYGSGVDVLMNEKRRQDFLMGFSLGMSRLTWRDLFRGREAAIARVEREYQDTCRRLGTSVEDLSRFRAPARGRTSRASA